LNQPADIPRVQSRLAGSAAENLRGLLLPITTPFTSSEEIDSRGLQANIRAWNTSGVLGYVVLGSTGERVNLEERECQQVIEIARAEVPRELGFIVGAGQESRRGTINEIKRAAAAGADAVLVITPHFYRAAISQAALVDHYLATAEASPVPVLLYSMPDLTGVRIEPETAAQLSQHRNIIGIKDSSADMAKLRETIRLSPADFAVLTGNGTVLYEALRAGVRGAILAVGCVATFCCLEISRLVAVGNYDQASALQEKLTPLALAVTKRYGIGGLKAAMNMLSLAGGAARLPLDSPSAAAQEEIASLLAAVHDALPLTLKA
jgi:4-hydroxy-2-oxoglutarate aldolase